MMENTPQSILLLLGRIDGKLDSALLRIKQSEAGLEKHDDRLAKLERNKAWGLGAAFAISALIGLAFRFLGRFSG